MNRVPAQTRGSRPGGRFRALLSAALICGCAKGELRFVSVLEIDSLQGVEYSVRAFERSADLPQIWSQMQAWLAEALLVPAAQGVAQAELVRIFQVIDTSRPPEADNPVKVALLPITDDGALARQALAGSYGKQETRGDFTFFSVPTATNLPAQAAIATTGRHMFASPSPPALEWAWKNRVRLINAPKQLLPGTLRLLVNPLHFADLNTAHTGLTAPLLDSDRIMREFESLCFAFTLDGTIASATLQGTPRNDSSLAALVASMRAPLAKHWQAPPERHFFALLSNLESASAWQSFTSPSGISLLEPFRGKAPPGDRVIYLTATPDNKGLCLVQLAALQPGALPGPLPEGISADAAAAESDVIFTRRGQRQHKGIEIDTFSISLRPASRSQATGAAENPEKKNSDTTRVLLSLLLKYVVLERAVARDCLVTVLGPEGSIDQHLAPPEWQARALPLNRKIGMSDPALKPDLALGGSLTLSKLLRHAISIMPGVGPEHLRLLPAGGDGALFGAQIDEGAITASIRVHTTEIAALQRFNRNGRAALQEIFLQTFTQEMMLHK